MRHRYCLSPRFDRLADAADGQKVVGRERPLCGMRLTLVALSNCHPGPTLTSADLHDASLEAVRFDWKTRTCSFDFQGSPGRPQPFSLTFVEVSALQIPASFPWGPSVSVLEFRNDGSGRFEFQMQSGDTLVVASASSSFELEATAP
jgi:hypothetical protein